MFFYVLSSKGSRNQWGIMKMSFENEDLAAMRAGCCMLCRGLVLQKAWQMAIRSFKANISQRYQMVVC